MGLSSGFESNAIGSLGAGLGGYGGGYGFGGGYGGGFGGIGLFGLLGLKGIGDLDGRGRRGDDDNCAREAAVLAAIANSKDATVAEGRALGAALITINDNVKDGNYAAAIQAERNTAQLAAQAQAFQIATDKSLDALAAAGVAQTAAIIARINQSEVDGLRDQLHETRRGRDLDAIRIENNNTNTNFNAQFQAQAQAQLQAQLDEHRRRWDARENEINIVNTNTNINAQAQAQAQAQSLRELDRDHRWNARFDALVSQNNKSNQDIVNLGTMVASGVQTPTSTNVNSKQ